LKRLKIALALLLMAAAPARALTLGYTGVNEYMAAFVAADQGFFTQHGVDVTLQLIPNGGIIPPALLAGSLDVGGITAPLLLQAAAGGLDIVVLSGGSVVKQDNPNGSVMARTGADIHKPEDFLGRKVAVSSMNSFYHVLFRQWLQDMKVDPDQVHFVEVPFLQMGDVLRAGQIDAATTTQPFIGRLEAEGIAYEVSPFTAHFPNGLLSNLYVVTKGWAVDHPSDVAGVRAALAQAVAYIPGHKEDAEKAEAKYLKLTPDQVKALPFSNYTTAITPQQIEDWNKIGLAQHLMDHGVDAGSVILP
jgi:NitT/TauT family transport system substrate-binding protein